jgi:hypothetical protein
LLYLYQGHAVGEQVELVPVPLFKTSFPRMHSDQACCASSVLVVASAERQNLQVRAWLGASVDVVDADNWLAVSVDAARDAAELRELVVQPFLCRARLATSHWKTLPFCPGSLLFEQGSEQSLAFGQRLFPHSGQRIIREKLIGICSFPTCTNLPSTHL